MFLKFFYYLKECFTKAKEFCWEEMSDRLFPEAKQAVDGIMTDIKKGKLGDKPLFKLEKKYF